jgi:predicted nucleotidyltransferase component of viral defense system
VLELKEIESFYPETLRPFKRNLLREYLQYKILEIIFSSSLGQKLSFMGGTAIRILYANSRFSEDLDFDNRGLSQKEFVSLVEEITKRLSLEGYTVEVKNVFKGAFRSYLNFTRLLSEMRLSPHRAEKLMIQVDTEPQNFIYTNDLILLNKFDVLLRIRAVPIDILLAQKIYCLFKRPRAMGRDFYDVIYLSAKTKANADYLKKRLEIQDAQHLKESLLRLCGQWDFKLLSKDVEPFLFHPDDSKKVLLFQDYINSHPLL